MRFLARGRELPDLFSNAAKDLAGLLVDPTTIHPGGIRERVRAEAPDRRTLLLNWLKQVLFVVNFEQMALCAFHIRSLTDTAVEAEASGELFDPGRHGALQKIKSVSSVILNETADGWEADVTLEA